MFQWGKTKLESNIGLQAIKRIRDNPILYAFQHVDNFDHAFDILLLLHGSLWARSQL